LGMATSIGGCDRQPTTAPASEPQPTATAPEPAPLEPRDADDAPDAPRTMPRSGEVSQWTKTQPIEVAAADRLADFVEDAAVRRVLAGFKFDRLARATYESPQATARVLLAEAKTPADAIGAFSVLSPVSQCTPLVDGSLRASAVHDGRLVLTGWQNNVFVRMDCQVKDDAGHQSCEALLRRTLFGLPMAEPPLLLQAVKEVPNEGCRFWVVRSAAMLRRQSNPRLDQIDPAALNSRLGLSGEAILTVVSVEQTRGAAPIIIWLAKYPSPADAKAAADRYGQALADNGHGLDAVTHIGQAKGRCLMGTWTADQEAARELVKLLEEALPESD
ncbi:MAG TPA: hypothetical protein PLQ89_16080, partial [Phycisphaerae bacterium]|nr:hypothetical protein [Phycisphaerae bacterium]